MLPRCINERVAAEDVPYDDEFLDRSVQWNSERLEQAECSAVGIPVRTAQLGGVNFPIADRGGDFLGPKLGGIEGGTQLALPFSEHVPSDYEMLRPVVLVGPDGDSGGAAAHGQWKFGHRFLTVNCQ